jgi:hypothetical protein
MSVVRAAGYRRGASRKGGETPAPTKLQLRAAWLCGYIKEERMLGRFDFAATQKL